VYAFDLMSKRLKAELTLQDGWWFEDQLVGPGTFSASMALNDPKCTPDIIAPAQTVLVIQHEDRVDDLWGGILWDAKPNYDDRTVTLEGAEIMSYFYRRRIREFRQYWSGNSPPYPTDTAAIARDLLIYAQAQSRGSIGVFIGTETSGVDTAVTYPAGERRNVGEEVEKLGKVNNGFDVVIRPVFVLPSTLQLHLVINSPGRGRANGVTLEYPGNAVSLTADQKGSTLFNWVDVMGSGSEDEQQVGSWSAIHAGWPRLEQVFSDRNVNWAPWLTQEATYYAGLGSTLEPDITWTLQEQHGDYPGPEGVKAGDVVRARVSEQLTSIDTMHKVLSVKITPGEGGQPEQLEVSTMDLEAWSAPSES
jgi:hypothetical protein